MQVAAGSWMRTLSQERRGDHLGSGFRSLCAMSVVGTFNEHYTLTPETRRQNSPSRPSKLRGWLSSVLEVVGSPC